MTISDQRVAGVVLLAFSGISVLSCAIVMSLIGRLRTWKSGYHRFVFTLAFFQCLYDLSYFLVPGYRLGAVLTIYRVLNVFSGIAVCLWTNLLSYLVLHTIAVLQPLNVAIWHDESMKVIVLVSGIFALLIALLSLYEPAQTTLYHLYFWIRAASTFVNVLCFLLVAGIFQDRRCAPCIDHGLQSWRKYLCGLCAPASVLSEPYDFGLKTCTQDLLRLLTSRLVYYPIVQILARITSLWWEYTYGFSISGFDASAYSVEKWVSVLLYSVCSPSAGIGYAIVFLYLHPQARRAFQDMLHGRATKLAGDRSTTNSSGGHEEKDGLEAGRSPSISPLSVQSVGSAAERTGSMQSIATARNTMNLSTVPERPTQPGFFGRLFGGKKQPAAGADAPIVDNPIQPSLTQQSRESISGSTARSLMHSLSADGAGLSVTGILSPLAFDLPEEVVWQEFFRRKLERESMTVLT